MIKLSQRAWNNVIIVSMLILIMLFNFSSLFLSDGDSNAPSLLTLVAPNMTITTMAFEQEKVERIGQGWRTTSGKYGRKYSNEELVSLVEQWTNANISLFDGNSNGQSPLSTVQLWFAGQALPIDYHFMQLEDKTLVKINKQIYLLISPSYQMLTLSE
ncbi:hypothetical protein [uncultured Paraglaciecola sp.]|jgi:hypothetical protein|uniref:hypothetical protein n=1 Tax=uncultured Paraglaciecola sp. TaxID=1765024 RepID=UPI002632E0B4|nr:hypothetical protein [uncultured Paraglaciecola sp.]